jgi:tRNA 2-thiouridine synthesizing protein C
MDNTITIISRSAPYGSANARLCIDIALAAAVFEQAVNFVLLDDGVYQLLSGQTPAVIDSKSVDAALEVFELYGIDNIYVDEGSLSSRNLSSEHLAVEAKPLDAAGIAALIEESATVINL